MHERSKALGATSLTEISPCLRRFVNETETIIPMEISNRMYLQ